MSKLREVYIWDGEIVEIIVDEVEEEGISLEELDALDEYDDNHDIHRWHDDGGPVHN